MCMDNHFPQISNPNPNPNPNSNSNSNTINPPSDDDLLLHHPTGAAISLLKDVIFKAESTIQSLSTTLFTYSESEEEEEKEELLVSCPYHPHHRVPPQSLFRHSLRLCNSTLPDRDRDRDIAHLLSPSNSSFFFYKDCPGVVSFPDPDPYSSNKTFILPSILSDECIHQHHPAQLLPQTTPSHVVEILPSDFWVLRREVEAWTTDYPTSYSYTVLRVASALDFLKVDESGLHRWLISNSPRFGIAIDVAMTDHVFLLLKLCLKVLQTEALTSFNSFIANNGNTTLNHKYLTFNSPNLARSLSWFASQLSVLYGEANSKLFTLDMLKESLLSVGLSSMVFQFGRGGKNCCVEERQHSLSKSVRDLEIKKNTGNGRGGQVLVSQVAAAVAALHDRFLLEQRIKALQFPQPVPKLQLVNEYLYASTRACEVREKRPNYKAISEHDSLLWHQGNNKDLLKEKTKEELLAEERDYKRRRMSYRGKKVKRNPTEVLREIIEEKMEEIKQQHRKYDASKRTPDLLGYDKPLHPRCNSESENVGILNISDGTRIVKDVSYNERTKT